MQNKNYTARVWQIITAISILVAIVAGYNALESRLDKKIEEKINDPQFIETLSANLRPYLIFDNKEIIFFDRGALKYIEEIKVVHLHNIPDTIIVTPKNFLPTAPLIEPLGPTGFEITAERGKNLTWVYKLEWQSTSAGLTEKFRLEILK